MAWTSPRTWVTSETVTAALLNTHLRDNLAAIGDAWTSYGSGASWTGSVSNPSIGNGTWAAAYMQAGQWVQFRIRISAGSTTTYGSGSYSVALPVAASAFLWQFTGTLRDASSSGYYPIRGRFVTSMTLGLVAYPNTAGNPLSSITPTAPITLANGDDLVVTGSYEAA